MRRGTQILLAATLGGAVAGALAAAVDWRRILLNGDFIEVTLLTRLWLTVTAAGALAGLAAGLITLLLLALAARRRARPLAAPPGGFGTVAALAVLLLLVYLGLRAATPFYEGRLPRQRMDESCGKRTETTDLPQNGEHAATPASVIVVVLDTVRADHLSLHGYRHRTTPVLEKFAEECLVCDSARSTASWTLPAHGSLFTGLYPSQHRMHSYRPDERSKEQMLLAAYPMTSTILTLPQVLQQSGYQTAAIFANPILNPHFRLDRGFDAYLRQSNGNSRIPLLTEPVLQASPWSGWLATLRKGTATARQINGRVTHWLDRHSRAPFFLFVNYMDAHWPYLPPPPYDTIYPGKGGSNLSKFQMRRIVMGRKRSLTDQELAGLLSQYDGEIRYLDSELGRLFDHLRRRGLYDSSLIIVTSDHGEYFGEHQLVFHGRELYEGGVKIPLLVKYPGGSPRGRFAEPVGLEDVFPTVLSALGLPVPGTVSGVSLGAPRTSPTVSENYYSFKFDTPNPDFGQRFDRVRRSLVQGRHKFIHSSDGQHELYDLHDDPEETSNLLAENPELAAPFLEFARQLEQTAGRPRAPRDQLVLQDRHTAGDDDLRKQLEELGYLEAP